MKIGSDNIGSLFLGNEEIGKAYLGDELVHGEEMPYDAKIEYLETTGTQYIDTGIKVASNTRSEVKGQYVQNNNTFDVLLGCQEGTPSKNGVFVALKSSSSSTPNKLYLEIGQTVDGNASAILSNAQALTLHTFIGEINGSTLSFTIDGTTLTGTSRGVYPTNLNLFLFAKNVEGIADRFANARVYYCKIWQGGNLVFDAYPVRVGSVGYLYDTISGQLYGNAGSGSFILGNDLTT